jgi:hypothetical protein
MILHAKFQSFSLWFVNYRNTPKPKCRLRCNFRCSVCRFTFSKESCLHKVADFYKISKKFQRRTFYGVTDAPTSQTLTASICYWW